MCTGIINADKGTEFMGRPVCITPRRTLVPIAQGKTPDVSLAIYVGTNKFRMDRRGEKVIERNPLAPIPCSQHGQAEMLASTGLGLSKTATILWVKLLKNFVAGTAMADLEAKEVDDVVITEMETSNWSWAEMMGVEIAIPCKTKKESTHWLICQPRTDAENLHWDVLKRDALGIWQTECNIYCIVPVGYRNVLFDDSDDDSAINKLEFFESNAIEFREACQQELDALDDEERKRKSILPDLMLKAREVSSQYAKMLSKPQCFGDVMPPELAFDAENEEFIYGGESERLTVRTLAKYEGLLKRLQQQVTEFETQSQRVDGFRELLRGLKYDISIVDCYGVLNQTVGLSRFRKNVAVELTETEAIITVLKADGTAKSQKHFIYAESRSAIDFNSELERLGLRDSDNYDYNDEFSDEPASACSMLKKIFSGCFAKA